MHPIPIRWNQAATAQSNQRDREANSWEDAVGWPRSVLYPLIRTRTPDRLLKVGIPPRRFAFATVNGPFRATAAHHNIARPPILLASTSPQQCVGRSVSSKPARRPCSRPWNGAKSSSGDPSREGPMVRIHLPPAKSRANSASPDRPRGDLKSVAALKATTVAAPVDKRTAMPPVLNLNGRS